MELDTIGIDLGKTVFHLVGMNRAEVVVRRRLSPAQLLRFTGNLRFRIVGMEACGGSHFFGHRLRGQGHEVRLIPAVRQALREDEQERLHRCRSHRGSRVAAHDAVRADQER